MAAACTSARVEPGLPTQEPCAGEPGSAVERVCREDSLVETLQARFRATVTDGEEERTTDGVLLVRRPDAVRVKLFGLGGMTVHDATWVGDDTSVRGLVRRPLSGDPLTFELQAGQGVDESEAQLSLALWALWRPRCATTPTALATEPGWLRLDPDSAHAMARDVRVGPWGVDEERLVRAGQTGPDEIQVVYAKRDCRLAARLPTQITMSSISPGWRADIRILDQEVNVPLDDRLFALTTRTGEGS